MPRASLWAWYMNSVDHRVPTPSECLSECSRWSTEATYVYYKLFNEIHKVKSKLFFYFNFIFTKNKIKIELIFFKKNNLKQNKKTFLKIKNKK
jgi:hypothetical protein